MSSPVHYALEGNIGMIEIDNPPVNALSHAVRAGLSEALTTALSDASEALVLICSGKTFIAGADITEFGKPPADPTLAVVLEQMEGHPKILIAALHGTALGGGLETALCCDYRLAQTTARVGLPEVKLGLLPGAGGTQRLPRLAGIDAAIQMITSGNPIDAKTALKWQIVDRVTDTDLREAALAYARELLVQGAGKRPISQLELTLTDSDRDTLDRMRATLNKKTRGERAPQRILDCIAAAGSQPFEQGLKTERAAFVECMEDSQSRALRHLFFAERQAARIDGAAHSEGIAEIKTVGIIGAGTMGGGIAMCFAQAGFNVRLLDRDQASIGAGLATIRKNYDISVQRGRLTAAQVDAYVARIEAATDMTVLADADLVIEAVFENLAIKQEVFAQLDTICKPDAILASNTSYQSIDEIAEATQHPERVIGMHFFSPANVMKLLEVVRGRDSSLHALATAMAVGKRIGKVSVLAGMCYGFIGNRMLRHYGREAALCVMEGASPAQVDQAMERWGMAMGPLAVGDLAGLDIGYRAREQLSESQKGPRVNYLFADRLVEAGRLGQKSGAGYYRYDPDTRARLEDPEALRVLAETRAELGITPREIDDTEIVDRLTLALINEGAKVLDEGIAQRAGDIDVVYCYGYGFPRFRGGPMHFAEAQGLAVVADKITAFHDRLTPDNWQLAPLLQRLAASGSGFSQ